MGTRTLAQVAPTAGEIALNAYIHGYGGHSLVTPHAALKQLWWTDQRIEAKVTKAFVISKLRGEEREFLKRPLAFGEGLTDDSYLDWILDKAKRLFLVLTEIGAPDQIFGCIDDCWTDDDLPVPYEDVPSLELSYTNDESLNQRFYRTQFVFLLRALEPGLHIEYGPQEHIPMEYVNTLPPAVTLQPWDRVHFPGNPEDVFVRRKFTLTDRATGQDLHKTFVRDVKRAQQLCHTHIAPAWASYVSEDAGYILSDFVGEHTLRTFMDHRTPMQFMRLAAHKRPVLLCQWMHCLADAVAYMHHRGTAHGEIRPSNILIDHNNNIAFAEVGNIDTFKRCKKQNKMEAYDYAAPESQVSKEPVTLLTSPSIGSKIAINTFRKLSISSNSSSSYTDSSSASSAEGFSYCTTNTSPASLKLAVRSSSLMSLAKQAPFLLPFDQSSIRNFSRLNGAQSLFPNTPPSSSGRDHVRAFPSMSALDTTTLRDLPVAEPEMSDIYSLGCVFLDILTFMLRGKLNDFIKFRTSKLGLIKGKIRLDTSFMADLEKIDTWVAILEEESQNYSEQIYRGVPDMLKLVRQMLAQNALLRPTSYQVRERLFDILVAGCGVTHLCCAGRTWPHSEPDAIETVDGQSHGKTDARLQSRYQRTWSTAF